MSKKTCGGKVPVSWEYLDDKKNIIYTFFLRDDQDAGITEHDCWSLFCQTDDSYGRLMVYSHMFLDDAVEKAKEEIEKFFKKELDSGKPHGILKSKENKCTD